MSNIYIEKIAEVLEKEAASPMGYGRMIKSLVTGTAKGMSGTPASSVRNIYKMKLTERAGQDIGKGIDAAKNIGSQVGPKLRAGLDKAKSMFNKAPAPVQGPKPRIKLKTPAAPEVAQPTGYGKKHLAMAAGGGALAGIALGSRRKDDQ